jgi:hypothetical protein
MAEPKIFTRNYIDAQGTQTSTHGGSVGYLYNRNPRNRFITAGAGNDATTIVLDITFKEAGVTQLRDIDTVALLNHNLKTWALYWRNGSSWDLLTSESADNKENSIKSFTIVSADRIKLEASLTQISNAEKAIGEMIVCGLQIDIGVDFKSYEITGREKARETILGDGSLHRTIFRQSAGQISKYEDKWTLDLVPTATRDSLYEIKQAGEAFYWQPESSSRPEQFFYVHWASPWREKYASVWKAPYFEISGEFKEA